MGITLELKGVCSYVESLERRIKELEKQLEEKNRLIEELKSKGSK